MPQNRWCCEVRRKAHLSSNLSILFALIFFIICIRSFTGTPLGLSFTIGVVFLMGDVMCMSVVWRVLCAVMVLVFDYDEMYFFRRGPLLLLRA